MVVIESPGHLSALFEGVRGLRAVLASALEGRLGRALVDDATDPGAARLDLGCYSIFGGDPALDSARMLVAGVAPPRELVFPDSDRWRTLLHDVHDPRLSPRPMRAYSSAGLDLERARRMARNVSSGIEIRRIDAKLAVQLDGGIQPHALQVFESAEDFANRGTGFGAVNGSTLACAATSYAFSSDTIELAIATRVSHRGRGLATCVAAALIADCLEHGITPHWNAANPVSQRLAERLGYRPDGICEVLFLGESPPS